VDLSDYLRRQFAYNAWANREVMTVIRRGGETTPQVAGLMAHIFSAEGLWLERLRGEPQSLPVWPELDLEQCEARGEIVAGLWAEYLKTLAPARLAETISYRNSKGEFFTSVVQDILTHAVMHSAYHRGQIASLTRAHGGIPAQTDFIHAVRQGYVE
jgi:uncharacterized damage-inducible protein DinB